MAGVELTERYEAAMVLSGVGDALGCGDGSREKLRDAAKELSSLNVCCKYIII